jgi:hypothetical protein
MERCTSLSSRLGNEPSTFRFTTDFFTWWRRQLVVIEDFPYAGVYFRGSANLVLPEGIEWDVLGTKLNLVMYFYSFIFYIVFYVYNEGSKDVFVSACRERRVTFDGDADTRAPWGCPGSSGARCCSGRNLIGQEEPPRYNHGCPTS